MKESKSMELLIRSALIGEIFERFSGEDEGVVEESKLTEVFGESSSDCFCKGGVNVKIKAQNKYKIKFH